MRVTNPNTCRGRWEMKVDESSRSKRENSLYGTGNRQLMCLLQHLGVVGTMAER